MKFTDLGDKGPDFIREMDSQGYRGSRDSVEDDADKKEYSGKVAKPGDVVKQGAKALDNAFNHKEDDWSKDFERRMKKGVAEGLAQGNYNVGLEDIGKPVTVDGESGYVLLSIGYSSGNGKLTAHILQPDTGSKGTYDLETISKGQEQGVAEAEVDEASLAQMRDYFNQADSDSVKVDRNYDAPSKKQNPLGVPPEIQALVNKMYHAGKISPQEFEVLRKFQQKTKINVGIREADKNPYAIGMASAMKSTGDKPPLKKSTINKAHAIARAIKKGD